jgi:Bacterial SH3 domain
MKKLLLLAIIFFSFGVAAQQSISLYVAAKSGLSIRETPDATAKVLDKIPYGTKITLQEYGEEKKSIITEGVLGYWQKVKYNNKTGYIIDSYLFPLAPPKLASVKEMKNYLAQVTLPFGSKQVVKSGTMNNIEESGWQITKQLYKNGAEWHKHLGYEYGSDVYFLPDFTIQQGFLLLRLIPEFKDLVGEKDEFPTESRIYKKGDVEYIIKVDKIVWDGADYPWIEKIHFESSPDVSYSLDIFLLGNQLVISFSSGV